MPTSAQFPGQRCPTLKARALRKAHPCPTPHARAAGGARVCSLGWCEGVFSSEGARVCSPQMVRGCVPLRCSGCSQGLYRVDGDIGVWKAGAQALAESTTATLELCHCSAYATLTRSFVGSTPRKASSALKSNVAPDATWVNESLFPE
jgi:hypothetical protein